MNVAAYDYSGYGGSTGTPTEDNVYADVLAVHDFLEATGVRYINCMYIHIHACTRTPAPWPLTPAPPPPTFHPGLLRSTSSVSWSSMGSL